MALSRIAALPRRDWRTRAAPYVEPLSDLLRAPGGTQTLRLAQAGALLEAAENLGCFVNGRVGIGKTLAAAMASVLLARKVPEVRTLILCPGGIKSATNTHFGELRQHWKLPHPATYELMSYNIISLMPKRGESIGGLFGGKGPTVIICDEADALKNVGPGGSAVARQIDEWMQQNPNTIFIIVTGTCDVDGLTDYGHLLDWCLRGKSPLPRDPQGLLDWSEVIDLGCMNKAQWICQDLGIPLNSGLDAIRDAYRERVCSAPGVIIEDTPYTAVDLIVREHVLQDPALEDHYARLRDLWQRPDGIDLAVAPDDGKEPDRVQGSTIWPVARRMGRGLCYVWDPPPPEHWMKARRDYFGWVRSMIQKGFFYTEFQAREHAIEIDQPKWLSWQEAEPTYTPISRTIWMSEAALQWCQNWGGQGPGVIWVDDIAFGTELTRRTGWRYYQSKGRAHDGAKIQKASGQDVVIASRKSCGTGLNLQYQWHRCLFVSPVNKSRDFEQNVGRFHREGQTRDVEVDILLTCLEDFASMHKTIASARRTARSLYSQKAAVYSWPRALMPDTGRAFIACP